ncbi:MAG: periplasmic heavy metal sensor [Hyphomicrobium sp.]|uniref:periplasmic heavy metal sensor n=1 Tax=Hyphomicrobium sp. TaxID=82 RepID=UPI0025BC6018|nr:periplasmic heavy metal sensor [Hyphomicrobium sp.]MBX9861568.1 periplasmic heavy metal sensor [Hyphomicrobium sp.]
MSDLPQPPSAAPDPGKRRLKYALIASLALNLLILGAVAGTMLGHRQHMPRGGPGGGEDFGMMGLTRVLPDERRKEMRKLLREDRASLRPLMDDVRTARRAAADKLAAEPFDRAALDAAISSVAEKERTLRQTAVKAFLGHVETLKPDERAKLAEFWRKKSEPPHRKKKDEKGDDDKGENDKADKSPVEASPPPAPPTP